jgi:hypothetical protein
MRSPAPSASSRLRIKATKSAAVAGVGFLNPAGRSRSSSRVMARRRTTSMSGVTGNAAPLQMAKSGKGTTRIAEITPGCPVLDKPMSDTWTYSWSNRSKKSTPTVPTLRTNTNRIPRSHHALEHRVFEGIGRGRGRGQIAVHRSPAALQVVAHGVIPEHVQLEFTPANQQRPTSLRGQLQQAQPASRFQNDRRRQLLNQLRRKPASASVNR